MKKILLISVSLSFTMLLFSQHFAGHKTELFNNDWKFFKGTPLNAYVVDFKDKDWVAIDLPHDWSIEDLPQVRDDGTIRINLVPFLKIKVNYYTSAAGLPPRD